MLAFLDCLRCGTARRDAVELAGEVDGEAAVPVLRVDLLDAPVGPAMPALLTRQSRPPRAFSASIEEAGDLGAVGDVADGLGELRVALPGGGQRRRVDVADVHARALAHEGAGDLQPDARRARRHQHAQALDAEVHGLALSPHLHREVRVTSGRPVHPAALQLPRAPGIAPRGEGMLSPTDPIILRGCMLGCSEANQAEDGHADGGHCRGGADRPRLGQRVRPCRLGRAAVGPGCRGSGCRAADRGGAAGCRPPWPGEGPGGGGQAGQGRGVAGRGGAGCRSWCRRAGRNGSR